MTIASFCRDQLLADGPLPIEELAVRASAAGVTRARNPISVVQSSISFREVRLPDGRWVTPLSLLEGRWLTTRPLGRPPSWDWMVGEEWSYDPLEPNTDEDLAPLLYLLRGGPLALESGGQLRASRYSQRWQAPKGWPDLTPEPHQLLAFRVVDHAVHVEVIDETPEVKARGDALAAAVGPVDDQGCWNGQASDKVTQLLWPLLLHDADLLTAPASPISSCIAGVARSIYLRRHLQREQRRHWRPQLDLPSSTESIVHAAARDADMRIDVWLNAFVTSRLSELPQREPWFDHSRFGWAPEPSEVWEEYPDASSYEPGGR